jgi:hypothetical protein
MLEGRREGSVRMSMFVMIPLVDFYDYEFLFDCCFSYICMFMAVTEQILTVSPNLPGCRQRIESGDKFEK